MANQNQNNQYNYGVALSGRCFEMKQLSETTVLLRCAFFSRLRDKNDKSKGYVNGLPVSVFCTIGGDGNITDIEEKDYKDKNVTVWGKFYMKESEGKDGKVYTNTCIYADKVEETVFNNSNNGGNGNGGNGGGWGQK